MLFGFRHVAVHLLAPAGALEAVATGSEGQRRAAPGLLCDLLADRGTADVLQASLAADEAATQVRGSKGLIKVM